MSDIKLGNLVRPEQSRDAIHIAITPVMSDEKLEPGQHVGLVAGTTTQVADLEPYIGIVDPFLRTQVQPGQQFWLLLYPQTITSLRHEWTHPAFPAVSSMTNAQVYLTKIASTFGCSFEDLVQRLDVYVAGSSSDDDSIQQGLNGLNDLVLGAMWASYQIVRGVTVDKGIKNQTYFSCAC